ncbi:shikimate dehydrogenase [Lichenibacterium ramalinae]|uniref:Shikimate dehydrogenase (NADP(+)) n=1 Tax=Lichenibacterium ramalinae TaxID=2316527 RepID=A0A4Q2RIN8_9HYPH|nr:shikimate dehydrogenase [Lichenibacterium ramalinae]RYB07130.1 shikimate dehydrogenase [Lichenibacterium ramalinae]
MSNASSARGPRAFVIGHPVGHSRSPLIHGHWLEVHGIAGSYERVPVAPEDLDGFVAGLKAAGFVGGNVTVPHKSRVLELAEAVDEAADAIGAANTLWFDEGELVAGNTDALGFLASLDDEAPGWDGTPGAALVLGAGGAARAVIHGLLDRGFEVAVVNRTLMRAVELAEGQDDSVWAYAWEEIPQLLRAADLVVNTTTLGMAGQPPLTLDLAGLKRGALVVDIVYTPLETPLLAAARAAGHRAVGGLGMLLHQAVPGFERWFGVRPEVTPELRALIEADVRRG